MRAGAGYVTVFVPGLAEHRLRAAAARGHERAACPTPTARCCRSGAEAVRERSAPARARSCSARAWAERRGDRRPGPGPGRATVEIPLLLDADGLNAHAGRLETLAGRPAATVLTPHAGELGPSAASARARRSSATGWPPCARQRPRPRRSSCSRATTRLVAEPSGRVAVSPRRRLGTGHRRDRRCPLRRHRRLPGQADGPLRGRLRGGLRARPGRAGGGPADRDRGRDRPRRDRGAARGPPGGLR